MSIPNKQIGWSNESNLLWQIAKQLERLTGVTSKISGSGGSATVVTKAQVDALIASSSLVPGGTYIITGVDVPLYGGTTIMLQAETTNNLTLAGHGIFYNPKYQNSQLTPGNGYGIWSNYITLTMSSIVGTFTNGQTVTANNGATATYLAKDFLSWISGDWSAATSISNGSGATANVTGGVSPSYAIGQDVIWGGKHWTNTSGNVGTADDKYTLSSADWTAVAFNSTDYNVEIDVIHYDYLHDMIIRRKDRWNNDVDGNFQVFDEFSSPDGYDYGNPIKDFQWGNGNDDWNTDDYYYLGVQSNLVKDSYLECINFIGDNIWFNTLTQQSWMHNNITNANSYISNNTLSDGGYIVNNTLSNISGISNNTLSDGSGINNNTLSGYSGISNNTLSGGGSGIYYNTLSGSGIYNNTLSGSGYISGNTLSNGSIINSNTLSSSSGINNNTLSSGGYISGNTLSSSSGIYSNTLSDSSGGGSSINNNTLSSYSGIYNNTLSSGGSSIYSNTLSNSGISNNTLSGGGISNNTLSSSGINNNTLSSSYINDNTLTNNSTFNFSSSGTLTSKIINYIEASFANATFNISAATIIFTQTYSKQMFRNSAGVTRLGYYNGSDVFTVVNVNA